MAETKIVDPSDPIDYRYGGETWDSLVQKLMATLPHIYKVLNALNGTGEEGFILPKPATGAIARTSSDGSIDGTTETADRLSTPRKITIEGSASGSVSFDGSKDVVLRLSNVTGNASGILGKAIDGNGIADGTVLVFRESYNGFVLESKGTVGSGKILYVNFGTDILGKYNGDSSVYLDLKPAVQEYVAGQAKLETDSEGNLVPTQGRNTITPITNKTGSLGTAAKRWENAYIENVHGTSDRATGDGDGNNISRTYATKEELQEVRSNVDGIPSTYATKAELQEVRNNVEEIQSNCATKNELQEIHKSLNGIPSIYATKNDVQNLNNQLQGNYVSKNGLTEDLKKYVTKEEAVGSYVTKDDVRQMIEEVISQMQSAEEGGAG